MEESSDVELPQVMEETVKVVKHIPQERAQNCVEEQMVVEDAPDPQIREETGKVTQLIPKERSFDRFVQETVAFAALRFMNKPSKS